MDTETELKTEPKDVAEAVKAANRSAVARDTHISLSGVSRILSGRRGCSTHNLARIAECLQVGMADLYFYLSKRQKSKRRVRETAA